MIIVEVEAAAVMGMITPQAIPDYFTLTASSDAETLQQNAILQWALHLTVLLIYSGTKFWHLKWLNYVPFRNRSSS